MKFVNHSIYKEDRILIFF